MDNKARATWHSHLACYVFWKWWAPDLKSLGLGEGSEPKILQILIHLYSSTWTVGLMGSNSMVVNNMSEYLCDNEAVGIV